MFDTKKVSLEWAGRTLTLETGRMARLADAAVLATYGETTVLATVVGAKAPKDGIDFFPLTVNYQEKFYASGRIPGGFFKREGRPTERETLISRLIDRPVRPLFVEGFKNEVQVVITTLSYDLENESDILAMVAASAALTLSGLPFMGPIGAARVGHIGGKLVLNPTIAQMKDTRLDLVVAGTADAIMMVESEVYELSEDTMLEAVMLAQRGFQPVIEAIIKLAETAAKDPIDFQPDDNSNHYAAIKAAAGTPLAAALKLKGKQDRAAARDAAYKIAKDALLQTADRPTGIPALTLKAEWKRLESDLMREAVLSEGHRLDGRSLTQVRPIVSETGVLPRTHGSALFTRGETQALVVATLGTNEDQQMIDGLEGIRDERFMLHYNFPPFSVGEAGRMGSPGRREIGHGKLAFRALQAVLPKPDQFPYTLRVVSEILESNGSSSMATVCGSSLAMMDAGVPLTKPVAGIAMGLIKEGERFAILSDILGDEDHLGDMDFKVAGTEDGITALQMDIKITGITEEIMRLALAQAKEGRMHILGEMAKAITGARATVAATAPKMVQFSIPTDKIREVIGSGGKIIREIVDKTGAKVSIEDDGSVKVSAVEQSNIDAAVKWIRGITDEAEVGKIYEGTVVSIKEFGAFVNFFGSKDGLVHVSQMARERVKSPSDVVKEGQKVWVKFMGFDDRGKTKLSMKVVDQKTGKELARTDDGED
jgi:polyribonucleotide nucleotidyltransferase